MEPYHILKRIWNELAKRTKYFNFFNFAPNPMEIKLIPSQIKEKTIY